MPPLISLPLRVSEAGKAYTNIYDGIPKELCRIYGLSHLRCNYVGTAFM